MIIIKPHFLSTISVSPEVIVFTFLTFYPDVSSEGLNLKFKMGMQRTNCLTAMYISYKTNGNRFKD